MQNKTNRDAGKRKILKPVAHTCQHIVNNIDSGQSQKTTKNK